MICRDSPWMMLIPVTNNRGGNEDSEQIFPLRPSRLECNFEAMTSAAGKNETSHHPSDLLSSKIGCSNEISVLHWKQVLCWSHLGCIRTKFLKSWFHVIDDYRLKFFSSAGLPWSPTSNSLIHHECSQLTSTARIKASLWAMYSWTTFKSIMDKEEVYAVRDVDTLVVFFAGEGAKPLKSISLRSPGSISTCWSFNTIFTPYPSVRPKLSWCSQYL